MRTIQLILGTALTVIFATVATSEDKPPPKPAGVLVELRGPPEGGNFDIDVYVTVEGRAKPQHNPAGFVGYSATALKFHSHFWRAGGYVVEAVGESQLRFVGWKDKNGKVIPVVGVRFESKDLRPDQLPTVVHGPKNKG